jgi:hypothetical protein
MPKTPKAYLQGLIGQEIRLNFARADAASAEGTLLGFDDLGIVLRRADRTFFMPWHVLRSIDAVPLDG